MSPRTAVEISSTLFLWPWRNSSGQTVTV